MENSKLNISEACKIALIDATDGLVLRMRGGYTAVIVDSDEPCEVLAELHYTDGMGWFCI